MRQVTYQPLNQVMMQRVKSIHEATECTGRVAAKGLGRGGGGTASGFGLAIFMVDVFHFSYCDTKVLRQTAVLAPSLRGLSAHHWPI